MNIKMLRFLLCICLCVTGVQLTAQADAEPESNLSRRQISSFNNGESIEITYEGNDIVELTINGKTIDKEDYSTYQEQINSINQNFSTESDSQGYHFDMSIENLDDVKEQMQLLQDRMRDLFDLDVESRESGFSFHFDGDSVVFRDIQQGLDSTFRNLIDESSIRFRDDQGSYELEELIRERERELEEEAKEGTEAESMEHQWEMKTQKSRSARLDSEISAILSRLHDESLIPDLKDIDHLHVDSSGMTINGKAVSEKAHHRFVEIYKVMYNTTNFDGISLDHQID